MDREVLLQDVTRPELETELAPHCSWVGDADKGRGEKVHCTPVTASNGQELGGEMQTCPLWDGGHGGKPLHASFVP